MAKNRPPIKPASRAEFVAAMKDFADEMKSDLEMVQREQARLIMRDAMTFSPPMPAGGGRGLSIAAQKAGKNKLGNDVRRIFIPQDSPIKGKSVLLRQVINAVKGDDRQTFLAISQTITPAKIAGLSPVMRKIMDDTDWQRSMAKAKNYLSKANIYGTGKVAGVATDFRPIHDMAKGAVGGRWPKGRRYNGPQYFAATEVALADYIAKRQEKVGWVKAGYADAMSKIPLPTTKAGVERNYGAYDAPWVDANRSGFGTFTMNKTSGGSAVASVVGNNIGNINSVADESDVKNIVYGLRVQNMMKSIQQRKDAAIKRANRKNK
jgi:hypothetical protein